MALVGTAGSRKRNNQNPAPGASGAGVSQGQAPTEPAKVQIISEQIPAKVQIISEQIKENIRTSIEKQLKLVKGDLPGIEAQELSERLKRAILDELPFDLLVNSNIEIEYHFDEYPHIVKYIVEDDVTWGWMRAVDTINVYIDNEKVMEIFIFYDAEFVKSKKLYIKLLKINEIEIKVVE